MRKTPFVLFSITLFYLASNFLAPMMLEPGSVEGLNANANRMDYGDDWKEMMGDGHVFEGIIYAFGDINCHQNHNRSYEINENQMPVCARDIGIFSGGAIGFLILFLATPHTDFYDTFFSVLPEGIRKKLFRVTRRLQEGVASPFPKRLRDRLLDLDHKGILLLFVLLLGIVPAGFDGFYQLLTDYESTNAMRIITGLTFGVPVSLAFGAYLMSGVNYDPCKAFPMDDECEEDEGNTLIEKGGMEEQAGTSGPKEDHNDPGTEE
jgi:uncharacterized membrane protein